MADIASRDELLRVLTERARAGNVAAVKVLLGELRLDDDEESGSALDALDGGASVTPIERVQRGIRHGA